MENDLTRKETEIQKEIKDKARKKERKEMIK